MTRLSQLSCLAAAILGPSSALAQLHDYKLDYDATGNLKAIVDITGQLPSAPASLSARAVSSTRIDLTWADASTTETGFVLERVQFGSSASFVAVATLPANTRSTPTRA